MRAYEVDAMLKRPAVMRAIQRLHRVFTGYPYPEYTKAKRALVRAILAPPPKPRRLHSRSGSVRCPICSPLRCSKAK